MFKFGFSNQSEDVINECNREENVISALEIKLDVSVNKAIGKTCTFTVNDVNILYFDQTTVLSNVENIDYLIKEAEDSHSDLVEGVYEGGLKIWECTHDVANYLCTQNKTLLSRKQVLDLGCGSGILGILAYKLGAIEVHFQDYNEGVIKNLTIPNVAINDNNLVKKSRFWCGDWRSFSEVNNLKYDVILTSETIYNPKNHKKLLNTLKTFLKLNGIIKSYYFGVGGGLKQFLDLIDKDSTFSYENIWKSETGVRREITLIRHK